MAYSFCPECGDLLSLRVLHGEERMACRKCRFVLYENSRPCVGVLALSEGGVLLVKRAIEPFKGYWDIPGGFLEAGEHPVDGAVREMREETGLEIRPVEILGLYMDVYGPEQLPTLNICYLAEVSGGEARASSDASDLAWFPLDELPDEIAFSWEKEALAVLKRRSESTARGG